MIRDLFYSRRDLLIENLHYAPVIGAASGVCLGGIVRLWSGIPSNLKGLPGNLVPFCHPVNSVMQIMIKGSGKYIFAFTPLVILIGEASIKSYRDNSLKPLKDQILSYETVYSISLLALTLLLSFTHIYWIPILAKAALNIGDLSEHILVVLAFADIFSKGMQSVAKRSNDMEKKSISLLEILTGAGCFICLFNTSRYYHTVIESTSALILQTSLFAVSHLLAHKTTSTV